MSWWSDLTKGLEDLPGEFWSNLKKYPEQILGDIGVTANAPQSWGIGGKEPPKQAEAPKQAPPATGEAALEQFLLGKIPQLTWGQENNPSQGLVQQLSQDLQGMSPDQAKAILNALPQGSTLGKDVLKESGPQQPSDALTMGLGMFFQQYLAPLMQTVNTSNQQTIGSWNQFMNSALQQQLPAGVKGVLQGTTPLVNTLLQGINNASFGAAAGQGNFQELIQGLGAQTSATQALQDAFTKAATQQLLYGGNAAGLSQGLQSQLGTGSLASLLAGLLGSPNILSGNIPGTQPSGINPLTQVPNLIP